MSSTALRRMQTIHAISRRAIKELFPARKDINFNSLCMDIEAADCDIPMDLDRLLEFDMYNFMHDVCEIVRHLNRKTAKLEDCFVPRCALPESTKRPEGLPEHPSWFMPV